MDTNALHETKVHGLLSFPYVIYGGMLPEFMASFPLHWHDEMEIIYITEGRGIVTVQSDRYICSAGDIVVIAPDFIHSISQYNNEHMVYYNVLFKFNLLEENANSVCNQKYLNPIFTHQKTIESYLPSGNPINKAMTPSLDILVSTRYCTDPGYELLIKSTLFGIMYTIYTNSAISNSENISKNNAIERIKDILQNIKENYATDITIEGAAKVCSFSTSHFMKLFKEVTGTSFTQYLNTYRLEIAAQELAAGVRKITDVAEDVGFHNISYFIRAFKNAYGVSPTTYREQMK